MDKLPDCILLDIFSRLDFHDLCMCARVCLRWRILTEDFTLKKVIVIKKPLQEKYLFSLIKNHFTEYLEEFCLLKVNRSRLLDPCSLVRSKKSLFYLMSRLSPNLKKLALVSCSLPNVSISDLPSKILHLSIRESELSPSSFFGSHPHLSLPHLTCLDLGGCNNFLTSQDLHVLTSFKSLKALYFEGCFRINNGGIECLMEILPQLEVIDIEGTDISNEGVHMILDNCAQLKDLYLGHTHINDGAFYKCLKDAAPNLLHLCVRSTYISLEGLSSILMGFNPRKTTDFPNATFCFNSSNCSLEKRSVVHRVSSGSYRCSHYLDHSCSRKI